MEKQTLTFTALPYGFGADGVPRLSVFVAPRLWADAPGADNLLLSQYPDLLNWPSRFSALTWQASINGGPALPLTVDSPELKPALWAALFHETTQVKPFRFEDHRGTLIESFPVCVIHDTIAGVYGRASSDPAYGQGRDRPDIGALAADTDLSAIALPSFPEAEPQWNPQETAPVPFPDGLPEVEAVPTEPAEPEPERPDLEDEPGETAEQPPFVRPSSQPAPTSSFRTEVTPPAPIVPPPPGKNFLPPPLTPAQLKTRAAFDALDSFLKPFEGAEQKLPDEAALAETWDFHQAVSSLGDYPVLLRRLGLVVDLLLPPGTGLPPTGTISVDATGVAWQQGTTIVSPRTHFASTAARFTAAPRPQRAEIENGFLMVNDGTRFRVIQSDVPGDAVKLRNAATHFLRFARQEDRPENVPGEGGLPALRTAGISLVRREITEELVDQFLRSCALNRYLSAKDQSPEPPPAAAVGAAPARTDELFAEDLVRGYRIDVFDKKTDRWLSLCQRKGEYRFLETVDGAGTETATDEGFVQFAATEPRDSAAPKLIRTIETLFTWNGWSLAAPRPGKAIMQDALPHADPANEAVTPFKVETFFKAAALSLPRLRFGRVYRLRARVADLAGNSVTRPGAADFDEDVPTITPEFTAVRYEPVAPPILMLQAAPIEGESVERLVVRTPAIGGLGGTTVRHIAPPKTSQLMAELHGKFDGPNVDASPAGYALASRESSSVRDDARQTKPAIGGIPGEIPAQPAKSDPWFQPDQLLTVSYLPDPHARGVGFTGLPGEAVPGTTRTIPFGNTWPDLRAFRIQLKAIPARTPPHVPTMSGDTMEVELAPAQRAIVRISSVLDSADLECRGVWKWTEAINPANLQKVKDSAIKGRHWAHLPWREITMVHAVQQPLEAPTIANLQVDPARTLGETFAILKGNIVLDAPSTGRVQLLAKWTDQIDDPSKLPEDPPRPPAPRTQTAHVCEIEVPEGLSPVAVVDSGTRSLPKHEFHDTKYHRVVYTPIAVTRFREYFPAATNTPDAATLRGPSFSIDVLNSARPASPKFLYALPLFEWSSPPGTPGERLRTRFGGGLRIYLERPWFSSGDGELLGVVFQEGTDFLKLDEAIRPFVTQWGADPIWKAASAATQAKAAHFLNVVQVKHALTLAENPAIISVAGHAVHYDPVRHLRFADIRIETAATAEATTAATYWPFVRLALVRFQPNSIDNAHVSRVFRTDFVQLPPRRDAQIEIEIEPERDKLRIHLNVIGPVYQGSEVITMMASLGMANLETYGAKYSNGRSEIEAVIESRDAADDPPNELSWQPIEPTRKVFYQKLAAPGVWDGYVEMSGIGMIPPELDHYRLKIKELEWYRSDDLPATNTEPAQVKLSKRVVYADVFALH